MKKYNYIILLISCSIFLSGCDINLKDINISGQIYAEIVAKLNTFLHAIYPNLSGSFGALVQIVATLVFTSIGIAGLFNKLGNKTQDIAISMFLSIILFQFLFNSELYFNYVVNFIGAQIKALCDFFVREISSNDILGSSIGVNELFRKLDSMFYTIVETIKNIDIEGGFFDSIVFEMASRIGIIVLLVLYSVVYIAFLGIFIIATFALHIYFLLGGIMIFLAAFKRTRQMFFSWLRAIANQSLVMIFASIVMSLSIFAVEGSIEKFAENAANTGAFFTIDFVILALWCVACFIMLLKVPDLAATVSGGMAGSTYDIVRTMSILGGAGVGAAGLAMKKLGLKAGLGKLGNMGKANLASSPRTYSNLMGLGKNK